MNRKVEGGKGWVSKGPVDVSNKGSSEDTGADLSLPPKLEVLGALGIEQCILISTTQKETSIHPWSNDELVIREERRGEGRRSTYGWG